MKKLLLAAVAIIIVVGGLILVFTRHKQHSKFTPTQKEQATVSITKDGFIPDTIKIKKGQQVVWVNADAKDHQVSADPHPSHTSLPSLSETSKILPGESMSFTFEKTGTFHYHDELNPLTFHGTVIVE